MIYGKTVKGKFLSRPNRFIALAEIDGRQEICHVKNTGRCKELLVPGADIVLEENKSPARKTGYDLIAVCKNGMLVNIDSQAPNRIFGEWVKESGFFGPDAVVMPEKSYKNSRFDFYIESESRKIYAEVKGVTLENGGELMFPDAPTERGRKHIKELTEAVKEGYEAYAVFVVQMKRCTSFSPNRKTDPEFARLLDTAVQSGVRLLVLTSDVTENGIKIADIFEHTP